MWSTSITEKEYQGKTFRKGRYKEREKNLHKITIGSIITDTPDHSLYQYRTALLLFFRG